MDEIKTKKCGHCGKELPIEMFHKRARSKDGYQTACKICSVEMHRESRARKKAQASELAFRVASIPSGENIEKITLSDGKTFRKVEGRRCRDRVLTSLNRMNFFMI